VARYVIRGGQAGDDRLQILHRDRWPTTAAFFERVGSGPGLRCVDLGCGGGEVSFEPARLVGANGRVDAAIESLAAPTDDPGSINCSPRIFQAWTRRT
jgi:hypothetical protein